MKKCRKKSNKIQQEEAYQITPKGVIVMAVEGGLDVYAALELYGLRNGFNAVLLDAEGGKFIQAEQEDV